jgi:perosamine synthetase
VLLYEGLTPVFCDVEKTTGAMDAMQAVAYCTKNEVAAVMCVHFGGYPCDLDILNSIRDRFKVPIIEDCAHAFGSKYQGMSIGGNDNTHCFSFHAVKNLSLGDGGAVTTNDERLRNDLIKQRWLGIDKSTFDRSGANTYSWKYQVDTTGYKYHMNDISAVIGLCGLKNIQEQNQRRKQIADFYRTHIKADMPEYNYDRESSYHFFPVFVNDRDNKALWMMSNGISCGVHYSLNCDYTVYKDFERINDCKNARWFAEHEITLPIGAHLSDAEVETIVEVFNK